MHPDKPILFGRCGCLAPGCRRTFKLLDGESGEVICGKCWRRLVSSRLRARHKALCARSRKMGRLEQRKAIRRRLGTRQATSHRWDRLGELFARNWNDIKVAVIEASAGI